MFLGAALGLVQAESRAASCAFIQALACFVSCRKDSISDGLSRFEVRKVAGFGLGERVESVAGGGSECRLDILESLTGLASSSTEGFIVALHRLARVVSSDRLNCCRDHFTPLGAVSAFPV